jgi:hypothetical protein
LTSPANSYRTRLRAIYKIKAHDLRAALADIERAEANGFLYCEAVFDPQTVDGAFTVLAYSDLSEKAHPTDGRLAWGRFQRVSRRHRFENGKLVPLEAESDG